MCPPHWPSYSSTTLPLRIFILHPLLILTIRIGDILDPPIAVGTSLDCGSATGWEASGFGDGRLTGFLRGTMDGGAGWVGDGGFSVLVTGAVAGGGVGGGLEGTVAGVGHGEEVGSRFR